MRAFRATLIATMLTATSVAGAELPAIVHKPTADVYARPAFDAAKLATLQRDTAVMISAQQGLWYELQVSPGKPGYLRVNDVRLAYAGVEDGAANMRVLMGGKAGKGRVTETAGVRGIEESDLKAAAFDKAQLNSMVAQRVDGPTAAAYAGEQGWQSTSVAYADEAKRGKSTGLSAGDTTATKAKATKAVGSLLGSLGVNVGSTLDDVAKVVPKSEDELSAEELALGPEITGRILGARPLWNDPAAQRRVNLVGRWVAAQTSRPDLPWTFGVIDSPDVNAFAAPGGYILITRGLYELLSTDSELAAALAHEISHCVQRDHYNVIHKQEMTDTARERALSQVTTGNDTTAGRYARRYADQHGAAIMLTSLDREAEYRADQGAEVYLARAGMNPLALYSLLQKLTALGSESASLAQLYKTHPPVDARVDRIDLRGFGALEPYTTRP